MKKIPPQFILGYCCENPDGTESFIKSEQHYSSLTPEEREALFTELFSNMDDISRNYNELIANGDIEQLSEIRERISQLGLNPAFIENVFSLAKKHKEQEMSKGVKKSSTRRIIMNTNGPSDDKREKSGSSASRKRRILLGTFKETSVQDISGAEEILNDGTKEINKGRVE